MDKLNLSVFLTTFVTIFIAELGDKTQFAALAASAQSKATFSVALAVVSALSLAGLLGVLLGRFLGELINPLYLKYASGAAFIVMGVIVLLGAKK